MKYTPETAMRLKRLGFRFAYSNDVGEEYSCYKKGNIEVIRFHDKEELHFKIDHVGNTLPIPSIEYLEYFSKLVNQ